MTYAKQDTIQMSLKGEVLCPCVSYHLLRTGC